MSLRALRFFVVDFPKRLRDRRKRRNTRTGFVSSPVFRPFRLFRNLFLSCCGRGEYKTRGGHSVGVFSPTTLSIPLAISSLRYALRASRHQNFPTNCVRNSRSRSVALRSNISLMTTSLSDCAIFSCRSEIFIWSCRIQESAEASFCSSGVSGELMLSNSSCNPSPSITGGWLGTWSANLIIALISLPPCTGIFVATLAACRP